MCYVVSHVPGVTALLIAALLWTRNAAGPQADGHEASRRRSSTGKSEPAVKSLASAIRPLLQRIPLKDIAAAVRYQFANCNALAFSFVSGHLKAREELRAQQERDRRAARRLVDLARATSPESGHRGRGEYVPH